MANGNAVKNHFIKETSNYPSIEMNSNTKMQQEINKANSTQNTNTYFKDKTLGTSKNMESNNNGNYDSLIKDLKENNSLKLIDTTATNNKENKADQVPKSLVIIILIAFRKEYVN